MKSKSNFLSKTTFNVKDWSTFFTTTMWNQTKKKINYTYSNYIYLGHIQLKIKYITHNKFKKQNKNSSFKQSKHLVINYNILIKKLSSIYKTINK